MNNTEMHEAMTRLIEDIREIGETMGALHGEVAFLRAELKASLEMLKKADDYMSQDEHPTYHDVGIKEAREIIRDTITRTADILEVRPTIGHAPPKRTEAGHD